MADGKPLKGRHNKVKPQQDCDAGKAAFFKNVTKF